MSELERASRAHRSLEAIERAARRAIRMIDDLLDVSAIDAGGLSFEASPYPVNRLVAETVETFRPLATERSIRLEANAATATTSEVLCDSGRILQVLSNLIGNALKFTPAGGEVTLSAEPRGRSVVFSVSDTGRGIPEDEREKVFARFWQQRPEGGHGVGLGLYISKSVVEAHGGRMGFESRPGGGTRFFFTLPGVEGADRAKAA
jgi:signal transduction histidine kinase